MNILIVDDIAENLYLLQAILEGAGYGVVSARNGQEAMDRLREGSFDLIVSDILMPVMDGFQLCRECKTNPVWKGIPFIFYTATYTEKKDQNFALSVGADAYVVKPQEPEALLKIISQVLSAAGRRLATDLEINEMDGATYLAEHNKRLIDKLENKMADLEKTNQLLRKSEEKYRSLFEDNRDALMTTSPPGWNFTSCNSATLKMFGVKDQAEFISLSPADVSPEIQPDGRPSADKSLEMLERTMREGHQFFEWTHQRLNGETFPCTVLLSRIEIRGKTLVQASVRDITEYKKAEEELQQSFERLRKTLGATVQAIAMVVEARDPYTAGHQKRVASLAHAIAVEMGIEANRIDGLRMAAMIHDIGKISVPAEILSKPTKLTPTEFSLIKVHPQTGYDILKDIDFPWPVAQMIFQHHEKMDGSGYPNGLKGDDILLDARIIAVADVVEAIASHRPYRPALGIDVALDEIVKNRGIFYDNAVADACLRLFREKGFILERA